MLWICLQCVVVVFPDITFLFVHLSARCKKYSKLHSFIDVPSGNGLAMVPSLIQPLLLTSFKVQAVKLFINPLYTGNSRRLFWQTLKTKLRCHGIIISLGSTLLAKIKAIFQDWGAS